MVWVVLLILVASPDAFTRTITLEGHKAAVTSVATGPGNGLAASADADGVILVWNIQNHTQVAELHGHSDAVNCLAISPDGELIASAGDDETVRVWKIADQTELHVVNDHSGSVNSVAFSPDGALIASAGDAGTVRLHDVASGTQTTAWPQQATAITVVTFDESGSRIATGDMTDNVTLRDVATGADVFGVRIPNCDRITAIAFVPNRDEMVVGHSFGVSVVAVSLKKDRRRRPTPRGAVRHGRWNSDRHRSASSQNRSPQRGRFQLPACVERASW